MQHDIKMYLLDISNSINSITEYIGENRDFAFYESNKLIRRGVEREIEIIGEAINKILKTNPDIDITSARKIVNLRNLVIHAYDNVDNIVIWGIINKELPLLQKQVNDLLNK